MSQPIHTQIFTRFGGALVALFLLVPVVRADQPPPLQVADVSPDPAFDSLFVPQQRGFLGADGAASVPLGPDRVLWIFGDTTLGTVKDGKREGPMVRNSIAIHTLAESGPGAVTYHWDFTDRITGDFFHSDSFRETYWYWPGTGLTHRGKTYLFITRVAKGGPGGFGFKTIGTELFRIPNPQDSPDAWKITHNDLGVGDDHFNINTACLVEGDYVYLLGYDDGPDDKPMDRAGILARMPVSALESDTPGEAVEYWCEGDEWKKSPDTVAHLYRPGATESSLHYDPVRKRYITVAIKPFSPDLYLLSAEKLTGPWSEPQKIYHIPNVENSETLHAYAGRAHPELTDDPNELLITYVVNTSDFWGMFGMMDIYYPRFIRVRFQEPAAEAKRP